VASPLSGANSSPRPTPIPNPVKNVFIESPHHAIVCPFNFSASHLRRALCSLHSFLNLPLFDLKFSRPFIFVLDHPVQLATNQDCKPSHVQPEHQDNDRPKRTVSCTVAVEKVQVHAETK